MVAPRSPPGHEKITAVVWWLFRGENTFDFAGVRGGGGWGCPRGSYSWFQCCVHTLIFRHDSTVMIRPRGYQAAQYFTLNILHPYRNQSTQSESYFNDSLNVSLVIQKKRTVIHNLFSFSDNSLSYKSRNLIAIHVIGRVDVSINKFFGSFLNFLWASTLIFKEISYFTLLQ